MDIHRLIDSARSRMVSFANTELTMLCWHVGERLRVEILKEKRAEYGEQIVSTLSSVLSWSHFKEIIYLKKDIQRNFYAEMCRLERWSVRALRKKISFRPEYKGQMELYPRRLDKHERKPGEEHPLGLILCADKSDEQVELLELGKSRIRVAQYVTQIPPRKLLERKLNEARLKGGGRITAFA